MSAQDEAMVKAFMDACDEPEKYQRENLKFIFETNKGTAHLAKHGIVYDGTQDVIELVNKLPLTSYDDYRSLCDAMVEAADKNDGEEEFNKLWPQMSGVKTMMFFTSSGTTGAIKRLPVTAKQGESVSDFMRKRAALFNSVFPPSVGDLQVRFGWIQELKMLRNKCLVGPASAIGWAVEALTKGIPVPGVTEGHLRIPEDNEDIPPMAFTAPTEWPAACSPFPVNTAGTFQSAYCHWVCALAKHDKVTRIVDVYAANAINTIGVMVEHHEKMIKDIREGLLHPEHCSVRPDIARAVKQHLGGPNPDLADKLDAEFKKGELGIIKRVFPRIQFMECITTGQMAKYLPRLREIMGSGIPIISGMYGASEALFAFPVELRDPEVLREKYIEDKGTHQFMMLPTTKCGYIEFLPVINDPEERKRNPPKPYPAEEAVIGQTVEVVVTTVQGFWRYKLGDHLTVVGKIGKTPIVEVIGRAGSALNLLWEKTSESVVIKAMETMSDKLFKSKTAIQDFTIRENITGAPGYYEIWVEPKVGVAIEAQEAVNTLERALGEINVLYGLLRQKDHARPLMMHVVQPGTFDKFREAAEKRGTSLSQLKIAVVLQPNPVYEKILADNTTATASSTLQADEFQGTA